MIFIWNLFIYININYVKCLINQQCAKLWNEKATCCVSIQMYHPQILRRMKSYQAAPHVPTHNIMWLSFQLITAWTFGQTCDLSNIVGEVLTPLVWKARLSRLYSRARKLYICHTFDLFWDAISCEMVNNMFNSSRNVITFHCFCLLNRCLPSDFFVNPVISAGCTNHLGSISSHNTIPSAPKPTSSSMQ